MKNIFILSLGLVSWSSLAETFSSRVHSIDPRYGFVRFENGRVGFLDEEETSNKSATSAYSDLVDAQVRVNLDSTSEIQRVEVLTPASQEKTLVSQVNPPPYEPTILSSLAEVEAMFERLNPDYKRVSECSDRAHVWSYDEFKKNGIKSQKVFAFFTASYINKNRFKWWFHVAPMVKVANNGQVESRVLDYRYMSAPATVKEWTDLLVFSKRPCKETTRFSEYDVNPQTEDCYIMYESMYYRLPGDLHAQELSQQYRESFIESEVNFARRNAFTRQGAL